jgi:uracil-DNA glycosylase family 4
MSNEPFFKRNTSAPAVIKNKKTTKVKSVGCAFCGLGKSCINPKIKPTGKGLKDILIITDYPSEEEDKQGKHVIDSATDILKKALSLNDVDLGRDCRRVHAVRCRPTKGLLKPAEMSNCRAALWKEIERAEPKLIIVLGVVASKVFLEDRWSKKFPPISALRGWSVPDRGAKCWVYYTFDLQYILESQYVPTVKTTFYSDIKNAINLLNKELITEKTLFNRKLKNGDKELIDIVTTKKDILNWFDIIQGVKLISIDYETSGIKPYKEGHYIRTCAISFYDESLNVYKTIAFPMLPEIQIAYVNKILKNKNIGKVAHFIPMEQAWGKVILKSNTLNWTWDTCLAAHVLDSRNKTAGLKFQTYVNFGLCDYSSHLEVYLKSEDEKDGNSFNKINLAPLEELLYYNGLDALYTLLLAKKQMKEIKIKKGYGYSLLHEGTKALCDVEYNGMPVDSAYCQSKEIEIQQEIENLKTELSNDKNIKAWKKEKGADFKLNSSKQLQKVLYEDLKLKPKKYTNKQVPSTDKESIAAYAKQVKFLKIMQEIKKKKTAMDFLKGWSRESVDGKLNPQFSLSVAETFRSACSHPNLQNIPVRDVDNQKLLRTAIKPSEGNQLLEVDFKGIEVCVSACYHKDPVMIAYIKDKSKDMHRDMAMQLFKLKKEEVSKPIRHLSKNGYVFPEFYGSYWKQVAPAVWDTIKEREPKTMDGIFLLDHLKQNGLGTLNLFTEHVKSVENDFWNRRFKVYAKWKEDRCNEYIKKGYLETLTGFRCSGPLKKNQIVNFPIQGSAFHCLLWTLIQLHKKIKKYKFKSEICSQVHDSLIINLVPEEKEEIFSSLKNIITKKLPEHFPWIIVPMELEAEITPIDGSWYDKKEINF